MKIKQITTNRHTDMKNSKKNRLIPGSRALCGVIVMMILCFMLSAGSADAENAAAGPGSGAINVNMPKPSGGGSAETPVQPVVPADQLIMTPENDMMDQQPGADTTAPSKEETAKLKAKNKGYFQRLHKENGEKAESTKEKAAKTQRVNKPSRREALAATDGAALNKTGNPYTNIQGDRRHDGRSPADTTDLGRERLDPRDLENPNELEKPGEELLDESKMPGQGSPTEEGSRGRPGERGSGGDFLEGIDGMQPMVRRSRYSRNSPHGIEIRHPDGRRSYVIHGEEYDEDETIPGEDGRGDPGDFDSNNDRDNNSSEEGETMDFSSTENTDPGGGDAPEEKVDKESSTGNDNGGGGCEDPDTVRATALNKDLTDSAKTDNRVANAQDPAVAGLARGSGQSSASGKPGTLPERKRYRKGYPNKHRTEGVDPEDGRPDEMKVGASVGVVNAAAARTGRNYQPPEGEDGPGVPDPRASDVQTTTPMIGDDGQPQPPPKPE